MQERQAPSDAPVLVRRVVAPQPPVNAISRERLVDKVLATPPGGVCLVTGPPGYGGTTLLALAAARSGLDLAWVSADPRHADPVPFWRHVLAALSHVGADVSASRAALARMPDEGPEGFVAALAEAMSRPGSGLLLLLDDLDGAVHGTVLDQLQLLLDGLSPTLRVLVRVQGAPGLQVSRLLTSGRLVLVDQGDLTLSDEDARMLVDRGAPGLVLARREALVELAEGWIAAIAVATSPAGRYADDDPAGWLMASGVETLLQPEVDRLPSTLRDFLVETSVLELLTAPGCDAVRGRTDSAALLAQAESSRTFLSRPHPARPGFRVHGLFREVLRRRLAERGPDAEAAAHRAAARWLAGQGDIEAAITHHLSAGDVRAALELLHGHVGQLLDSGRAQLVHGWYDSVPDQITADQQLHNLSSAWSAALTGNPDEAESQLDLLAHALTVHSERAAGDFPTAVGSQGGSEWLRADEQLLRGYLAGWRGYPARLLDHVRAARLGFGDGWHRSAHYSAAFWEARGLLWTGDLDTARGGLVAIASRPQTPAYFRHVALPSLRALLAAVEGRAHRANHLATEALTWLDRHGELGALDRCDALLARSLALADLDQPHEARTSLGEVAGRVDPLGHISFMTLAGIVSARVHVASGDLGQAWATLEQARQVLREQAPGSDLALLLDRAEADLRLGAGDPDVRRLLRRLPRDDPHRGALEVLVLVARRPDEAMTLLRTLPNHTPRELARTRLLAACCRVRSRPAEAQALLLSAADIAYEHGLHRLLVGCTEEIAVLAERLVEQDAGPAVRRLVEVARAQRENATPPEPVPTLSPGEMQLIGLLPGHPGNGQLARELGVSVNTVKTRLRRLYAKLGVHDREGAVARAADLLDHLGSSGADRSALLLQRAPTHAP
ncbi:MAG: LuxR C-terminal-related transcriptional regulator [Dermatophilaceae bacterium]